MSKPGKTVRKAAGEAVDREKVYALDEAVKLVKAAPRPSSTRRSRWR